MSQFFKRVLLSAGLIATISSSTYACHHHRQAAMFNAAPQPVFVPAPMMIYDAPAPVYYSAPIVSAPVIHAAPVIQSAPIVESAPLVESHVEVATPIETEVEIEETTVVEAAPVEVGTPIVEHAVVAEESAPLATIHQGPVAPSTYFYSLEPPLTQQPYAITPPPIAPPVMPASYQPADPTIFIPAPAPRRRCPLGGCH